MRGGLCLSCAPDKVVTFDTWRCAPGFITQALCVFFQALIQWGLFIETATLHDTTSLLRVLTVGLQVPNPNMRSSGVQFQSEHKPPRF